MKPVANQITFTYSDADTAHTASAPAFTDEKNIDRELRKSPSLLTLNDIDRGRSRFEVMTQEHQKRGLSPVAAAGLAAVKSVVPMSVAKLVRSRSVSKQRKAEAQARTAADWSKEFGKSSDTTNKPIRDPYDTSDSALEKAVDLQEKSASQSLSPQEDK